MRSYLKRSLFCCIILFITIGNSARAQFSAVGGGVNNLAYAMCTDGTNLYVAINDNPFDNANNYLLKWNGSTWSNLGYVNGSICALAYMGGNVYVGGTFSKANGAAGYSNIAAWNVGSSTWSTLGTGTNSYVTALTVSGSTLYAGGDFTSANGTTCNYVATWNGAAWSTINPGTGAGVNGDVWALNVLGGNLYVGGQFSATTSGLAVNNIVEWNGTAWSALTSGLTGAITINNIATSPDQLNGFKAGINPDPTVMAITNDGTNLYVGGDFTTAGGTSGFNNIAEWNGAAWSKLGVGMSAPGCSLGNANGDNANVYALAVYNGNLVAGGDFGTAGTYTNAIGIAEWNGAAWTGFSTSCGSNINSDVFALCVSNGILFAAGQFPNPNIYVAQYTGAGPSMIVSASPKDTICHGGSVPITASGATTYSWSPSSSLSCSTCPNPTASPTVTTTYTVTGTLGGCSSQQTIQIVVNPTPTMSVITNSDPNLCAGNGGSSTLGVSGNATSYTWSPSGSLSSSTGTSVTATPGSTTIYTVTATSAKGCDATETTTVNVTATPTVNASTTTPTICSGSSATIIATGATTYSWNSTTGLNCSTCSTVIASPGSAITYTVTGTTLGCTGTATVAIAVNSTPTINISANNPIICAGGDTTLTATGANTYVWSPSGSLSASTGNTVTATPGGSITYTVTGTGINTCQATATVSVTISPTPTVTVTPPNPSVCPGGNISLTANGATTYAWSPAGSLNVSTGATVTATPASATTYTVVGTNVNGCKSAGATVTVSVVSTVTVIVSASDSSVCPGGSTTLTASGASNYTWQPSATLNVSTGTSVIATPTAATTYTVIGTSAGCTGKDSLTININLPPSIAISVDGLAGICPGDSLTIPATGAGVNGTYAWTPATGLNCTTCSSVDASPSTTTTYTVTGTTAQGCSSTDTVTLFVYTVPVIKVSPSSPTICFGDTVSLIASGASNYSWAPDSELNTTTGAIVIASPTTTVTYTVNGVGTGLGACPTKDSVTVNVLPAVVVNLTPSSTFMCYGSSVSINATGATSYTWSPPGGLSCTSCSNTLASPGSTVTYTVTGITTGCSGKDSVTITVDSPIVTSTAASPIICSGSSTILSATGATSYMWNPPGGLSCTSCNNTTANPGSTTLYTVIGTDSLGCSDTNTVTLTVVPSPTITVSATDTLLCAGTNTTLSATGATSYMWSPSGGLSCASCNIITVNPGSTITYTVIGSNGGSCGDTGTIKVTVNTMPTLAINVSGNDTICPGSTATLTAASSVSALVWNTGSTNTSISVTPSIPSTYTVYATSGKCSDSATAHVNIYAPPVLIMLNDSICVGRTGIIGVNVSGGKPSYTYQWSSGLGTAAGPFNVNPANSTYYICTVTDACGQVVKDSEEVVTSLSPNVSFKATPDTIPGGEYVAFINTSTNTTSYYWNFGDGGSSTDSSVYHQYGPEGNYVAYLVGTNGSGCSDTAWDTIYVTQGIYVPNVFTPNGDGQNDVFHVTAGSMQYYSIEIFNRWGERVFQANSPNIDWTGRSMSGVEESDGDYYYMINATAYNNKTYKLDGYLQLIR